jgi:hypothetical protein
MTKIKTSMKTGINKKNLRTKILSTFVDSKSSVKYSYQMQAECLRARLPEDYNTWKSGLIYGCLVVFFVKNSSS